MTSHETRPSPPPAAVALRQCAEIVNAECGCDRCKARVRAMEEGAAAIDGLAEKLSAAERDRDRLYRTFIEYRDLAEQYMFGESINREWYEREDVRSDGTLEEPPPEGGAR